MAYTAVAYRLGKTSTFTIGSDVVTNCRVINLPTVESDSVDIPHLGGLTADVGGVSNYGELVIEVPASQAFTSAMVQGTEYTISVSDGATTLINGKKCKLKSTSKGNAAPADPFVATYTFKMTEAPW